MGIAIVPTSLQHGFNLRIRFMELGRIPQRAILYAVWKKDHRNRALDRCIEYLHLLKPGD